MEDSSRTAPSAVVTRAGFVALLGRPNAGKSTLLNALVGEHLAAVSPKEQTTRHRIPGFRTTEEVQIVFVDTPGLLDPRYLLQEAMLATALESLEGVDLVYFLVDHDTPTDRERDALRRLAARGIPVFLVLTKADASSPDRLEAREAAWRDAAAWAGTQRVSAVTESGIEKLLEATHARLPEQPFFYPADQVTDLTLRFVAAELVREACYDELGDELPYSVHVVVDEWKEPDSEGGKTVIRATIYVERESQKAIVIGEGGRKLKAIGMRSRRAIETLVDGPVYLALWVKVRKKWSRREGDLRWFGYRR
jgi:GTP-binding protein Era